ncbi:MAG TPA: thioredoxin [Candidatus Omnitrophota bacterium]|jgi:thioredoxin 1|nr:thioredoxin [Candidatus Omnitrophota bacterium]HSA30319.1 thioredoxin [Candidatus Omnitrophota bacterium]
MPAIHLKSSDFDSQVVHSAVPVLVDFYAEWCGPCKMLSPIVDQIADELQGKAKIVKIDVDQAQELAAKFNIMSIPNLLIFKDGAVVEQLVGVMPKDQLLEKINAYL